jgi:hypothetical protein
MAILGDVIGRGTLAARPAAGTAGRLYYVTDDTTLYRDSGSAWEAVEGDAGTPHDPVTVTDTASINLTLTGQDVSAAAIFGTTAGTVAEGDHSHSGVTPALDDLTDVTITTPADGHVLTYDGAGWVNEAASGGGETALRPWLSGMYYDISAWRSPTSSEGSAGVVALGTLAAVPVIVPEALTVDRIAINVSSAAAAGNTARLGIYANGADDRPGALILDAGTVAIDATGVKEITISQALSAGVHWLVLHPQTGFQPRGWNGLIRGFPFGASSLVAAEFTAVSSSQAYGALPNPFPSSPSAYTTVPRIALRRA